MLVLLPILFSVLLSIGLIVTILIGLWFQQSYNIFATGVTAALLGVAGTILGVEGLEFAADLQGYVTPNELFIGKVLAISAAVPAVISLVGGFTLAASAIYRYVQRRQLLHSRIREMV